MTETTNIPTGSPNNSPLTPKWFSEHSAEIFSYKNTIVYGARRYIYREFAQAAEELLPAIR
ncbi:hypothetical protein [Cryobacterium sp. Y29]|uniref:hypothetical protein n=1 Tax=Cryobacterium sp. Y29 TaxID=2048285 RepID=UPI000CE52042|nr:hypothetical protein [Cryobacterium sp. Y29]